MFLYVILILVLASFVIAFFSAKTWHWGYVLVVEALFLATLGFFLLAAETVRLNRVMRTQVTNLEKQLTTVSAENAALRDGTEDVNILAALRNADPPAKIPEEAESILSIAQLDHELNIATRVRGRVWRNVTPGGINAQTGLVTVNVAAPVPAGIKADTVVYLFEEGAPQPPAADGTPRSAQYLGEFRIAQAAAQQASLQPVLPMDQFEQRRLAGSRGPWIMYETMPMDRYEIFAKMTEEQLKQRMPKQSVNEYLRHGKEATDDDDPIRKVGLDADGNRLPPDQLDKAVKVVYQRRLRDYAVEFDELSRRRVAMLVDTDAVKKDIERLIAAQEVAKKLQAFRTDEKQRLTTDLAGITKERQAIEQHLAQVQRQLAKARQLTADTLQRNRQLVAELEARQLQLRSPNGGAATPARATGPLALGDG